LFGFLGTGNKRTRGRIKSYLFLLCSQQELPLCLFPMPKES